MTVSRERILETLERGWGTYIATYDGFSQDARSAYLSRQGYARLADVLAHVMAWWREGRAVIKAVLADPSYPSPERDVDAFNAEAVEAFRGQSEPEVREAFETERRLLLELILALPPEAMLSEKIMGQLNMEVVGHLAEHSLADY